MFYAVIHRPDTDLSKVKAIAQKYDPTHELVGPHITLVFPISGAEVGSATLERLIGQVAKNTQPFNVHLCELELSWDKWLFLTPRKGRKEFIALHDNLYSDAVKPFLRTDIEFIPHVALGHFAIKQAAYSLKDPRAVPLDEPLYKRVKQEIVSANLDYKYKATEIELISINDEFSKTETVASFSLAI